MIEVEYIVGIYNYVNINSEFQNETAAFYLIYILDDKDLLDISIAHKCYDDFFKSDSNSSFVDQDKIGPFKTLEVLNQFAFRLCEWLNAEKVSLLSVQEYNILLESSHTANDFHKDLLIKGSVMENIERKKKGFLRRFF